MILLCRLNCLVVGTLNLVFLNVFRDGIYNYLPPARLTSQRASSASIPMRVFHSTLKVLIAQFTVRTSARLTSVETGTDVTLSNARLSLTILKSTGAIHNLTLDGQDLLGTYKKGSKGKSGIGPYLDCYCIKKGSGSYTPGSIAPKYKTFEGSDASGTPFAGVVMSETLPESGQTLSMFWTVSGEETGIHTFARVQYPDNPAGPTRQTLQEFRTLFRPNSDLWTHLSVNDELAVPRPRQSTLDKAKVVQDATWDLSAVKNDPFVTEFSDYFTKYSFADALDKHTVHGMFGRSEATRQTRVDDLNEKRQTKSTEGTWGAWLVLNSKDTFYGGPRHTDLTVDGIVYNYIGEQLRSIMRWYRVINHPSVEPLWRQCPEHYRWL